MPASVRKLESGKYEVRTPNGVHAKGTSKENAMAQQRLLNAVDHGWKPTGERRGNLAEYGGKVHRKKKRGK